MNKYSHYLVPGPTKIEQKYLDLYAKQYPSPDLEDDFIQLYSETQTQIQRILKTEKCDVVIQSGEAMVSLWGALRGVIKPNDKVLAIGTGVFGFGIGEMAKKVGANVEFASFGYNQILDAEKVREKVISFKPKLITVVHCETPSGTLNPIDKLGKIAQEVGALLYVDFVASAIGADVRVDEWGIDIGLLGTQKALSLAPDLGIVTLSSKAWKVLEEVNYDGYDALLPFKNAVKNKYFPYTMNWGSIAALHFATKDILEKDLEKILREHLEVAQICRDGVRNLKLEIFPEKESYNSPTLTAVKVPDHIEWKVLDKKLRSKGVCFGGSYGELENKVFRIGHMGSQCDKKLILEAIEKLKECLEN